METAISLPIAHWPSLVGLFAMSATTALIIGTRLVAVRQARRSSREYAPRVASMLKKPDWEAARTLSASAERRSHLAKVVLAGLEERHSLIKNGKAALAPKHMEQAMQRITAFTGFDYRRHLGLVAAVGSTAPFLGVLGGSVLSWVWGICLAIVAIFSVEYLKEKTGQMQVEMQGVTSELFTWVDQRGD